MAKLLLQDTSVKKLIRKTLKETPEGYILFENGDEWKKLFFKNGRLTGASSSSRADYLGQYLISYGVVNTEQFEQKIKEGSDPGKSVGDVLTSATPEVMKQIIYEKILDTIFIASRWLECVYSVIEEKSKSQRVDVEISSEEISQGLKERVFEFREILDLIPELGSRPKIIKEKPEELNLTDQHEIILNYLAAGKTVEEILSIMTPHNYLLFKCFFQLLKMGVLSKGTGAPLSREKVKKLVNESYLSKIDSHNLQSEFVQESTLSIMIEIDTDEVKHMNDITVYQKLHSEDPENSIYSHCFVKAKSFFILDFYSRKLSPFAVLGISLEISELRVKNEIDERIYLSIKDEGGRQSIRNLVKSMSDLHEIDILTSVDKLLSNGIVSEIEPVTFIDALKLGRHEYLEKLFRKEELNSFFNNDISKDLTPTMLDVISGNVDDESEEKPQTKVFKGGVKPVLYNYEMTLLMLASMLGNYEAVEFLLARHAKTDLHNGNGVTALMLALQNGYDDIALLLMQKGANVNAMNKNNYTALMIASSKGMAHIVDFMIKLGADVNHLNAKGQSAIVSALRFNHSDVVISLIAAGTDLGHKDDNGSTPVDYAESVEMTELMMKGAKNIGQIKKELVKKRQILADIDRDLIGERKKSPGKAPIIVFSSILVITMIVNVNLLFFPKNSFGLSREAQETVEKIGLQYCIKYKECRSDIPGYVAEKCHQMGIDIISEFFAQSSKCDDSAVDKCMDCLKEMDCNKFYQIDGANLSEFCSQCINVCR